MENLCTHVDLTEFPQIDRKEEIIETQKKVSIDLRRNLTETKQRKKRVIIVENHVMDFVILILFLHFV